MINSTDICVFFYTNFYYIGCVVGQAKNFLFNLDYFKRVVVWHPELLKSNKSSNFTITSSVKKFFLVLFN